MSLGYAERLSFREDLGGRLGAPEVFDGAARTVEGVDALAGMVRSADRVVAFTGAGISTACGIPDFRGPNGVWTLQRAGKPLPRLQTSFVYAKPSLTHMALVALLRAGKLTYICSQNVDGLHLRSGVPRAQLAELHGNCFAERCKRCQAEYVRDFEMESVGFKATGRSCTRPGCSRGKLHDHILDWEDALPEDELEETERQADAADLSICLGTSLQIIPAADLPLRTLKTGGGLAIVNLQATPKDRRATLVVHAKVDPVMALLLRRLGLAVPEFVRTDSVVVSHEAGVDADAFGAGGGREGDGEGGRGERGEQRQEEAEQDDGGSGGGGGGGGGGWGFALSISSIHGIDCPLPMVRAAHVSFEGAPGLAPARVAVPEGGAGGGANGSAKAPLSLRRWVAGGGGGGAGPVVARVRLELADAADEGKRSPEFVYEILAPASEAAAAPAAGSRTFTFETQRHDCAAQAAALADELEAAAAAERAAGGAGGGAGRGRRGRPRSGSAGGSRSSARYEEAEVAADDGGSGSGGEGDEGGGSAGGGGGAAGRGTTSSSGRSRKRTKRLNM